MKKAFLILSLVVLMMGLFGFSNVKNALGDVIIKDIAIAPGTVDSVAQYSIYISLGKGLNAYDNIYVKFPKEFTLPQTINKGQVEIAGSNPSSVTVKDNVVTLTLGAPLTVQYASIIFSSSIGIKNPSMPDNYSIEVWTTAEPNHAIFSFPITLGGQGSTVSALRVFLTNYQAGKTSEYDIAFTVNNPLISGDYVDIYFPKGTIFPSSPDPSKILFRAANVGYVSVQERRLRIYVPENQFIGPGGSCSIIILESFGIINPEFTGNFVIQVATSKDTGLATSNSYTLLGTSIQPMNITVTPSYQKANSEYKIEFKTSQSQSDLLQNKSKINVKFADEFGLPNFVKPGAITVNGVPCTNVSLSGNTLTIFSPVNVQPDTKVTVVITKDFGITNPANVGTYTVFVNTSSDPVYVSFSVSITQSTISQPQVSLSNTSAGQVSAYTITFNTGVSGNLLPGVDRINVIFPIGTTIPSVIPTSTVLVNGIPTTLIELSGTTLTITLPVSVDASGLVSIQISEKAGIRNPTNARDDYTIIVFTTKEQTPMSSNPYSIKNVPQTTLKITPEKPDGLNGFYKTTPSITFTVQSATDPNPSVYYYFDGNTPVKFSNVPILALEGIHTLYYYAIDKDGHKEETKSIQIKVDTIPPQIVILSPQDNAILNSKNVVVKGTAEVGSSVKINGAPVNLDNVGNFEMTLNVETSPMVITVSASDLAGNSTQKVLTVYLDTTPPDLVITKPTMFEQINKLPLIVEGKTEKGAKVTVNGKTAEVKDDGTFSVALDSLTEGQLNVIEVIATDSAQNSTKKSVTVKYVKSTIIKLQVGNKSALVNDSVVSIEVAPVIKNGRTMVPLRFIGETFGAQFSYDPIFKIIDISFGSSKIKMQVGNPKAFVNGKEVTLEVPPYISSGRTLVPLRFISEVFGAEVVWDGNTKTITIIYPKPR